MKRQIREVKIIDLITYSLLSPLAIVLTWALTISIPMNGFIAWIIYGVATLITYFLLKRSVIGLVLLYKVLAPMSVRRRCVFTPTCSTYMIMAIVKYGLFVGIYKGVRRLLRCHPPNGGEDYP